MSDRKMGKNDRTEQFIAENYDTHIFVFKITNIKFGVTTTYVNIIH